MRTKTPSSTKPTYKLTRVQVEQLEALAGRVPDTADIPPAPDDHWSKAERGRHYAAIKDKHTAGPKPGR